MGTVGSVTSNAGIIGARTNNGVDVAGLNWSVNDPAGEGLQLGGRVSDRQHRPGYRLGDRARRADHPDHTHAHEHDYCAESSSGTRLRRGAPGRGASRESGHRHRIPGAPARCDHRRRHEQHRRRYIMVVRRAAARSRGSGRSGSGDRLRRMLRVAHGARPGRGARLRRARAAARRRRTTDVGRRFFPVGGGEEPGR